MSKQPGFAMKVSDLAPSIAFLIDHMGFKLVDHQPSADLAYVLDNDDDLTLLAGPKVDDVTTYLSPPCFVFKPGDTILFNANDLDTWRTRLLNQGLSDLREEEMALGDRKLSIPVFDGYIFSYVAIAEHSPDEIQALYEKGPGELEAVLTGLSEAELDLSDAPDQWSIRQLVHHMAEGETLFVMQIKTALAQSGTTYVRSPYNQEIWPDVLGYAKRPVGPSVALVKAIRGNVLELLHYIPDNWERYVNVKFLEEEGEGRKTTVGETLTVMTRHLLEHSKDIQKIRSAHEL